MGSIKDVFDDANYLGRLANWITSKASKRALTRVLLMASVGIVILGSYLGYLTYLLGEYRKSSNEHNAKYSYMVAERGIASPCASAFCDCSAPVAVAVALRPQQHLLCMLQNGTHE